MKAFITLTILITNYNLQAKEVCLITTGPATQSIVTGNSECTNLKDSTNLKSARGSAGKIKAALKLGYEIKEVTARGDGVEYLLLK